MAFVPNEKFSELLALLKVSEASKPRSQTPEHIAFAKSFPSETLETLTLDQYCIGKKSQESFCWWIERGLQSVLGRYMPGTSLTCPPNFAHHNALKFKSPKLSTVWGFFLVRNGPGLPG